MNLKRLMKVKDSGGASSFLNKVMENISYLKLSNDEIANFENAIAQNEKAAKQFFNTRFPKKPPYNLSTSLTNLYANNSIDINGDKIEFNVRFSKTRLGSISKEYTILENGNELARTYSSVIGNYVPENEAQMQCKMEAMYKYFMNNF